MSNTRMGLKSADAGYALLLVTLILVLTCMESGL